MATTPTRPPRAEGQWAVDGPAPLNPNEITDRQNLQYHWIAIEDVPEIWRRLEAAGMQTTEACGDTPRVILGSPVAGISADEIIDPTPVTNQIVARFIGDESLSNLPRKFKSAITGHPSLDVVHEINDVSLVGVVHPDLGPGYDLWVGGGLSVAPRLAQRLGAFVTAEQAPDVWHAVIQVFRDYGYRRLRNRARLKFLLAEWGPQRFREVMETEYLGYRLADGPAPAPSGLPADHLGVHDQVDGRKYLGLAPTVGRVSGDILIALADAAEAAGAGRVRFTPHQKLLILDIPPQRVDGLIAAVAPLGLQATPSPFRRATMACTGIEYCKLAFVDTKDTAARVIGELDAVFGGGRRDEEKARAKERVVSLRDEFGQWDPRNQRPELWNLYNPRHRPGEHVRVFPLSNWTELDVWHYIAAEGIELPSLYYAHDRQVFDRAGMWLAVTDVTPPGNRPVLTKTVRYRTVGDMSCTGAVESDARTVHQVLAEVAASTITERGATRADDRLSEAAMEDRKKDGYF